jgi:hypothetical protein
MRHFLCLIYRNVHLYVCKMNRYIYLCIYVYLYMYVWRIVGVIIFIMKVGCVLYFGRFFSLGYRYYSVSA